MAIVYARDEEEALERARRIFHNLVERGYIDYYVLFNEENPVAGKARWGNLPVVARADSPEGQRLIKEGMDATWREFKENITIIRRILNEFSDEEIFEERPSKLNQIVSELKNDDDSIRHLSWIRYHLFKCSGYADTHAVWLFDNDGEPIENKGHLEDVLNKWNCVHKEKNPYEDLEIFVVPADVHW